MKNSLILNFILFMPEKIHTGAINVVNKINKIEIPSIPIWKLINPDIQFLFSINWKSEIELSKENHRKIDNKKLAKDEKIAT